MLKVVIRHVMWEEGIEIGEYHPGEVKNLIKLVEEFGVFPGVEGNEDVSKFEYYSSRFDLDQQAFEIVVD